jgi:hypothetical protein
MSRSTDGYQCSIFLDSAGGHYCIDEWVPYSEISCPRCQKVIYDTVLNSDQMPEDHNSENLDGEYSPTSARPFNSANEPEGTTDDDDEDPCHTENEEEEEGAEPAEPTVAAAAPVPAEPESKQYCRARTADKTVLSRRMDCHQHRENGKLKDGVQLIDSGTPMRKRVRCSEGEKAQQKKKRAAKREPTVSELPRSFVKRWSELTEKAQTIFSDDNMYLLQISEEYHIIKRNNHIVVAMHE